MYVKNDSYCFVDPIATNNKQLTPHESHLRLTDRWNGDTRQHGAPPGAGEGRRTDWVELHWATRIEAKAPLGKYWA